MSIKATLATEEKATVVPVKKKACIITKKT